MEEKAGLLKRITGLGPYVTLALMCLGLLLHLIGICTGHWMQGDSTSTGKTTQGDVIRVAVGLVSQEVEYKNATKDISASSLTVQTAQYVILTISFLNTALCFFILFKPIHVIVGTSGFISMTIMFVALIVFYNDMYVNMLKIQSSKPNWPPLSLAWSCNLVLAGLLISTVSTFFFLAFQLIKLDLEEEAKRPKTEVVDQSKIHLHVTGI